MTSSRRRTDYGVRFIRPVILSERSESKDLPDYGEPIAIQRQKKNVIQSRQRRRGIVPGWGDLPDCGMVAYSSSAGYRTKDYRNRPDPSTALRVTGLFWRWHAIGLTGG